MWLGVDRNIGAPRIASLAVSCWLQGAPCAQPLMWNTEASVKKLGHPYCDEQDRKWMYFFIPSWWFQHEFELLSVFMVESIFI